MTGCVELDQSYFGKNRFDPVIYSDEVLSTSRNGSHITEHDWVRYYLNEFAEKIGPERKKLYTNLAALQAIPHHLRSDIGGLPLASPLYMQLLHDHGHVFNFNGDKETNFLVIEMAFRHVFSGKTVFYLPGRTGQVATFPLLIGAENTRIGFCTDDRYWPGALSWLNQRELGLTFETLWQTAGVALLARAQVGDLVNLLAEYRNDLQEIVNGNKPNGLMEYVNPLAVIPDIVISTNMLNHLRFSDVTPSGVTMRAEGLLLRILAVGIPGVTEFYITPSTQNESALSCEEIIELLNGIADVEFYDPNLYRGDSVLPTPSDLTFRAVLLRKIRAEELE